ncbi:MAG: NAD-dependent epimerase/dehydratase family protein [Candidatus Liptonbacteria bacterium]|nr:NAD-dependent epimerase/dehydratase family protein [Candidatus Liptonbacteria bacterium]
MKIIVTGGAGFIGSHIVDAYVKAGHRVAVIDNLSTGFRKNLNPRAKFYKADIQNAPLIERVFKKERPEIVNHHAAIASVIQSVRNPLAVYGANVMGTASILTALVRYGRGTRKKIIFASSGGTLYGDSPEKIPADERLPMRPISPYGISKLLGEELIAHYSGAHHFSHLIFRYANVYGPRQNPKGEAGVVAIFGGLMRKGKTPVIFGDGTKTRDYAFVDDVARANLAALRRGTNVTLNIGLGKEMSDRKIFDTVAKYAHFSGKPKFAPERPGEIYRIALDAKKAKKILGWRPRTLLDEGIKRTVASL